MSAFGSARPGTVPALLLVGVELLAFVCCATGRGVPHIARVKVYFDRYSAEATECICKDPVIRDIRKTKDAEETSLLALQELIKGPSEQERAQGYGACLPSGGTIARYKETYMTIVEAYREQDGRVDHFGRKFLSPEGEFTPWGDRVRVRGVKIRDGTAYADFSKELYSYGGGSCSVEAIMTAIENTLKQFPPVEKVVILVEGRESEIEP